MSGLIYGCDPGSSKSAFVFFDPAKQRIVDMGILSNESLLKQLIIGTPRMSVFAIEKLASFGFSVGREVFDTAEWIGRFVQAASMHAAVQLFPVYRKAVVTHHTGRSTGGDKEVRAALIARFGKENLAGCKTHIWSALGVAAYASDKLNFSGGVSAPKEVRHKDGLSQHNERVVGGNLSAGGDPAPTENLLPVVPVLAEPEPSLVGGMACEARESTTEFQRPNPADLKGQADSRGGGQNSLLGAR